MNVVARGVVARGLMAAVGDASAVIPIVAGTTGLDSHCRSEELALGAVAFCGTQASQWLGQQLTVDPGRVGANYRSLSHLRINGAAVSMFDPLSGFFEAGDGWVRTHANYDWHRERLRQALGLAATARKVEVAKAIRSRSAQDVEDSVTTAGGIAVRMRTEGEFAGVSGQTRNGNHASAASTAPLLGYVAGGDSRGLTGRRVRVLDLTRVIAGPIATRTLASLGMDVLRIDPPQLPEIEAQHLDSGAGKRSAITDLAADRRLVDDLVAGADVIVSGYRPSSLAHLGLDADDLAARHPGKVIATIQAWPTGSPWESRRGFDSIVQVASGIALREARSDGTPGALSAQALDHSCGYLLAGGILHALRSGHGARISSSLTAAAQTLLALGPAATRLRALDLDDDAHLETVTLTAGNTLAATTATGSASADRATSDQTSGHQATAAQTTVEIVRVRSMWEIAGVDSTLHRLGSDSPGWS